MRLTQGFAVLAKLQEAGSEPAHLVSPVPPHEGSTMSKPGPPFLSWVGVKPNSMDLPFLGQVPPEPGKGREYVGWAAGVASEDGPAGWQSGGQRD